MAVFSVSWKLPGAGTDLPHGGSLENIRRIMFLQHDCNIKDDEIRRFDQEHCKGFTYSGWFIALKGAISKAGYAAVTFDCADAYTAAYSRRPCDARKAFAGAICRRGFVEPGEFAIAVELA